MLRALADNDFFLFERLINRPNCAESELNRCLLLSAQNNNIECLKSVLGHPNVYVNFTGSGRKTPAMVCAESGNSECLVRIISDQRCRINFQNVSGETALHYAVKGGNAKCIEVLLKAGAKESLCDNEGNTPLLLASMNRYPNMAIFKQLLGDKSIINTQNKEGKTALHYTCGQAMGTEILLSCGANPDIQDSLGNSPLHIAAVEGFDTIMVCLITYNCNVNLVNSFGMLPLHYVAMKGHWKVVEFIARAGGHLDTLDKEGKTPLIRAVENNRTRAVISLLMANCCPDMTNDGNAISPLETAFSKRFYHLVRLLLLFGASPTSLWKCLESDASLDSRFQNILSGETQEESSDLDESLMLIANCHSFQHLCRIKIRRNLRTSKDFNQHLRQLPRQIREYIFLENTTFSAV